jgi:hypothetical protein
MGPFFKHRSWAYFLTYRERIFLNTNNEHVLRAGQAAYKPKKNWK